MVGGDCDILVVDDQLGVRLLLSVALQEQGYNVSVAANGSEGVELAKKLNPQLIIMDIKMPLKDGITALYEIKRDNPWIKIIMMTAYEERDTVVKIKEAGAEGYVLKPFDIEEMINTIKDFFPYGDKPTAKSQV